MRKLFHLYIVPSGRSIIIVNLILLELYSCLLFVLEDRDFCYKSVLLDHRIK